MIIESKKTQTIDFPYRDKQGIQKRLKIFPGENEVDKDIWSTVKKDFKDQSPFYFKGLIEKGEKK